MDSPQSKNTKVKVYNICMFNWTKEGDLLKVKMKYVLCITSMMPQ